MPLFYSRILNNLPENLQRRIIQDLKTYNTSEVAKRHYQEAGSAAEESFYQLLLKEKSRQGIKRIDPGIKKEDGPRELTDDEEHLLRQYETGEVGYEVIQRVLSAKMFRKLLSGEGDVKASDWIRSEQLKLSKEKAAEQKDAMEQFIDALFSGFIPALVCPHCGKSTLVSKELIGDRSRVMVADTEDSAE